MGLPYWIYFSESEINERSLMSYGNIGGLGSCNNFPLLIVSIMMQLPKIIGRGRYKIYLWNVKIYEKKKDGRSRITRKNALKFLLIAISYSMFMNALSL